MPLPTEYETPEGQELAELAIRQAIADIFLGIAEPYLFSANVIHLEPRYVEEEADYKDVFTVLDPDVVPQPQTPKDEYRIHRYFAVEYAGHVRTAKLLSLRYLTVISMGFRDRYQARPLVGTYKEIVALNMRFERILADNQGLGLDDDLVSHRFYQSPSRPRFAPADDQGGTAVVLDGTLTVDLRVC
jgi:hypothetical protein